MDGTLLPRSGAGTGGGRGAPRFRRGMRDIASALGDPAREAGTRAVLRETVAPPRTGGLKALLERAPLEGIDLARPRDLDRDLSL